MSSFSRKVLVNGSNSLRKLIVIESVVVTTTLQILSQSVGIFEAFELGVGDLKVDVDLLGSLLSSFQRFGRNGVGECYS